MSCQIALAALCAVLDMIELGGGGTLTTNRPFCGS
jgi:hypothetical protein